MFPEWTWIVGLFIGAAIGSFLNVVIYRMPRGIPLSEPRYSYCPECRHRLTGPDLVPLLSWLALRGRCRHCRAPIPARYFGVEVVTGGLWAVVWWQHLIVGSDPARAIALSLFLSALVAAIYIDLRHFIIPDEVNAAMLITGIGYNIALYAQDRPEATTWGMPSALAGAIAGVGVIWGIAFLGLVLFRKDAMGHGDIKMARGMGAMLFPAGLFASVGMAVVLGAVLGVAQVALRARQAQAAAGDDEGEEDEPMEPELIGSLVKCGIGYLLAVDVVGLFVPRLYRWWFGEDPRMDETDAAEEDDITPTMIPFGPYLALGAIAVALFWPQINGLLQAYWRYAAGGE